MSETDALTILKRAILLETRGKAFYKQAAKTAQSPVVTEFFEMMAAEEVSHIKILSDQYKSFQADSKFIPRSADEYSDDSADQVITEKLKENISAAGFESAAISAAMGMEEKAINLYSQRAKAADDPDEKALYQWLAEWETQHLEMLAKIDREVTETIWNDNSFWPF
ncbi:MAG: rubrerythrin [Deltaproteobacteria bacterium]|nr:MAG: rubrerythrin [Deltaproteobacteria bacterium]RTZ98439.1 MAG: rubrerythrin [Deltaproteobacteria bacterium]